MTRAGGRCPRASGSNAARSPACQGLTTLATSAGSVKLTGDTWYTGKVVIDDDPNDANLQQLRFWADGTLLLTTTAVDDEWSAGYVGLYRAPGGSAAQQYDDVKIWLALMMEIARREVK